MIECPLCDGYGYIGDPEPGCPYGVQTCPECDGAGEISRGQYDSRLARITRILAGIPMLEVFEESATRVALASYTGSEAWS